MFGGVELVVGHVVHADRVLPLGCDCVAAGQLADAVIHGTLLTGYVLWNYASLHVVFIEL
jgi:hypothetical protein